MMIIYCIFYFRKDRVSSFSLLFSNLFFSFIFLFSFKILRYTVLSSTALIVSHVWVCGVEGWDQGKGWGQWLVGNGAVGSQWREVCTF
jgi:hypothetical protein